ncbi:putative zinc protease [Tepidimonas alkaliphilus]|uniref:Putative zinc protease n=2 Tax=Tepidimonas alkaliphilus TaxID=2588942 RepID=A0A554W5V6_9BURK|nr:putative zinc protease [Tepidimonas alkaliphilus]
MKASKLLPNALGMRPRAAARRAAWLAMALLAGAALADSSAPAAAPDAPPAAASLEAPAAARPHVTTLPNGLTVIVQVDRRAPTAVQMLWLRVGAVDETDREAGVAHVLEHMMFKGTPTLAEGEYSRRIAALGGRDNAFTARDVTAYHVQVPAGALREAMALEAERFARNAWTAETLQRELAVIREERRQRIEDDPQAQFYEQFMATALVAHPYRRPVIGWMANLEALDAATVRAFHQRWYAPNNAALVVVGDVEPAQVVRWAEELFGALPPRVLPARAPEAEPEQRGARRFEWLGRVRQPSLLIGWRVPRLPHPDDDSEAARDALALALLAGVLDGHSAARLERALVRPPDGRRLADAVGVGYGLGGRGPELFLVSATVRPGVEPARVEQALREEIARVARDGVSDAELRRVKNQWAAAEVFKLDSPFAQARELGQQWALGWPPDAQARLLARVQALTAADVQRVAQRYFGERQMTVGWLLPEEGAR